VHDVHYDPFDPAIRRDPYPTYAALRARAPLYPVESLGTLALSRYEDVLFVLRRPELFSSSAVHDLLAGGIAATESDHAIRGETLLGSDPPRHTRLRKIVNRGFTPSRVARREKRIRELAEGLLAPLAERRTCDLVADFAVPLPVRVIAEILGMDPERHRDLKRWSDDLFLATTGFPAPEEARGLARALDELDAVLEPLVEARRREPREDLVSALVHAGDDPDQEVMTESEVGTFVVVLLVAGNETTTHLIANAVLALFEHPAALAELERHPERIPDLVEETLRYDAPVQLTLRRAREDVELPSGPVRAGQTLLLLLGSANRDERVFPAPDRFDLHRGEGRHLAFGFGAHFCLGAQLARLEARIALEALLARLQGLRRLGGELEPPASLLVRGPRALPLAYELRRGAA